ncbi:MalY/PatB family protein [Ornithinibacillus salinisoli]|uniref:cysteine-S-conjugate beta-lyase n=1 Tax=Ornithinibacillus salinisoli TaxID=1848459 RepID=A0ABW4W2C4_9BACI
MKIFNQVHERRNTRSVKWDMLDAVFQSTEVLPMWVADMDFRAPEEVNEAIIDRARHGIYGYTVIDNSVKDAITNWHVKRHSWEINKAWLSFSPGVVTSLLMAIQTFTKPEDKILIQTPVYTPFYSVIEKHDRHVIKNPLVLRNNYYHIDFHDFEEKLKSGVKAFILCSPHNPVGRVWTKEELTEMAQLCMKYNVMIFSDEIHADLINPDELHIPIASLSDEIADRTITCMAPSKTFNLAGLQASYIITSNKTNRGLLDDNLSKQGHHLLNTMATTALEAAYKHGDKWLDELRTVLYEHRNYVTEMLEKHTSLQVIRSEGTYLVWIDCNSLEMDDKALKKFMIEKAKVGLNTGIEYGEDGSKFMRMNIACPRVILEEGVQRIIDAITNKK